MTIRHMRIFLQVYQTQNITRAARQLHMTQPAVTRAIQELERYYGVQLFERVSHRLSVTEVGKELYRHALHIVESFDALEKGLHNWDSIGVIRVGASITIGNYALPRFISQFRERHPQARVEAMVLNGGALQTALMDNQLDLALIENSISHPDLCARPYDSDEMLLIAPPDHPLLSKPSVRLEDLQEYDLLMREEGSAGRAFLESVFTANGLTLRPTMISISTQAIIRAVRCGLGLSILPRQLVEDDLKAGCICTREIEGINLTREHNIVWHRQKYLSPALQEFIALVTAGSSL